MIAFDRTDQSVLGRWWWTVDRWMLAALAILIGYGTVLIMAASPAVAERIGLDTYHFIEHHLIMLLPAMLVMIAISLLSPRGVRRVALLVFLGALVMVALTLVVGVEIKGARRWIHLPGLSVQPSEFVKPAFAVVAAWLFSLQRTSPGFPGGLVCLALYGLVIALLVKQPDMGMAFVITAVWLCQAFLAGLPLIVVGMMPLAVAAGGVGAYYTLPHFHTRIDKFLHPQTTDNYQVNRSLEAFEHGGLLGTGPGQGTVKMQLPDAHADFIFAVAGEELGLLWCLLLVALFAFIVLRGFSRLLKDSNLFVLLAASGLLTQFAIQALVNMGSSLHLMPTKGMTLPFVSYGGSSLIALGFGMGMVLALTRRRFGLGDRG